MDHDAGYCWASFSKFVFYGYARWPSYSYWLVPGTVTDQERCGWIESSRVEAHHRIVERAI